MTSRRFFVSCVLLLLVAQPPVLRADFSGDYALTPPPFGDFNDSASLGAWTLTVTKHDGGSAEINTSIEGISLVSVSSTLGSDSHVVFTYPSVPQAGTITFDYTVDFEVESGGDFHASANVVFSQTGSNNNSTPFSHNTAGPWMWTVALGDTLTFEVQTISGLHLPSTPTAASGVIVLENWNFTPVPEPGAYALGAGLLALGAVVWRRRRK